MARSLTIAQARRIALGAQGFAGDRPSGRVDVRHFRKAMEAMSILQLDSVNVLCRSHFLPMFARLGPYDRDRLDDWLWRSRENHEYWAHVASITPAETLPLLRWRMERHRWRSSKKLETEQTDYMASVLDEIRDHGPRSIRSLSDPGERTGPWWGRPRGKVALEWLSTTGRIAVDHRDRQFVTHYDLPERIVRPEIFDHPTPDPDEAKKELLVLGARSHGIGTDTDLADYFRLTMPEARPLLAQLVDEGRLEQVEVEGWSQPTYLHPDARRPRRIDRVSVLSPFDPVVWFRPRAERLFDFEYRIEIYVPESKRVYGYYVLPVLLGERLVGRVDLKADRAESVLRVRSAHIEAHADPDEVAAALAPHLAELGGWLGLATVAVEASGDLAPALADQQRRVG